MPNCGHVARPSKSDNTGRSQGLARIRSLLSRLARGTRLFSKSDRATFCETGKEAPVMEEPRHVPRGRGHLHAQGHSQWLPKAGCKPRVMKSQFGSSEDLEDTAAMASATRKWKEFKSRKEVRSYSI